MINSSLIFGVFESLYAVKEKKSKPLVTKTETLKRYYILGDVTPKGLPTVDYVMIIRAKDKKAAIRGFAKSLQDVVEAPAKLLVHQITEME